MHNRSQRVWWPPKNTECVNWAIYKHLSSSTPEFMPWNVYQHAYIVTTAVLGGMCGYYVCFEKYKIHLQGAGATLSLFTLWNRPQVWRGRLASLVYVLAFAYLLTLRQLLPTFICAMVARQRLCWWLAGTQPICGAHIFFYIETPSPVRSRILLGAEFVTYIF